MRHSALAVAILFGFSRLGSQPWAKIEALLLKQERPHLTHDFAFALDEAKVRCIRHQHDARVGHALAETLTLDGPPLPLSVEEDRGLFTILFGNQVRPEIIRIKTERRHF